MPSPAVEPWARLSASFFRRRRAARLHFTAGNRLRLFETGSAFFAALIERIDAATRSVELETYIFRDDDAGYRV